MYVMCSINEKGRGRGGDWRQQKVIVQEKIQRKKPKKKQIREHGRKIQYPGFAIGTTLNLHSPL